MCVCMGTSGMGQGRATIQGQGQECGLQSQMPGFKPWPSITTWLSDLVLITEALFSCLVLK